MIQNDISVQKYSKTITDKQYQKLIIQIIEENLRCFSTDTQKSSVL